MKKKFTIISIFSIFALAVGLLAGCSSDSDVGSADSGGGQGGSMARFTIAGNYLYTVDERNLNIISLADPAKPTQIDTYYLTGWDGDIETIFPYDGKLFIGSRTTMYIYDIATNPRRPQLYSKTTHFRSCDPVVAYGDRAYVTLNNQSVNCGGRGNFLLVYDISDLSEPIRMLNGMIQYPGTTYPQGLGVDGPAGRLFVCTTKGVDIYDTDITDPEALRPIEYLGDLTDIPGVGMINAYDVIPRNGLLMVIGSDGLFQFDYTDVENIKFISSIDLR